MKPLMPIFVLLFLVQASLSLSRIGRLPTTGRIRRQRARIIENITTMVGSVCWGLPVWLVFYARARCTASWNRRASMLKP